MRAAIFYGARDIRVEEVDRPKLKEGDVLLKIKACGICGTDLHSYRLGIFTEFSRPVGAGLLMGHEFSAEITEIAGQVEGLKVGDRVIGMGFGANAEYMKLPVRPTTVITPMPPGISYEEAATIEPLGTSFHAVNLAEPADGEAIVILGAGIIGLGVLQVLKATISPRLIAVVDLSDRRLAMAEKLGADIIINAKREDPYQKMLEITGAKRVRFFAEPSADVDTVFDCAGAIDGDTGTPVMWQALKIVRENGKVVSVALFEKSLAFNLNIIVQKGIKLLGSWACLPEEFVRCAELIGSGKINRKPLITHEFPLEKAKEAYETQLKAEEAIKVVLKP